MRTRIVALLAAALSVAAAAGSAAAGTIALQYSVGDAPVGGKYAYDFRLTVDNADGKFAPGQGWGWIVFGDVPAGSAKQLTNFALTGRSANDPFTGLTSTGGFDPTTHLGTGGHNGPTRSPTFLTLWFPTGVGDRIEWSGTSTAAVRSDLKFSTITYVPATAGGNVTKADFDPAVYTGNALPPPPTAATPLPAAAAGGAVLMGGLAGIRAWRRRRGPTAGLA